MQKVAEMKNIPYFLPVVYIYRNIENPVSRVILKLFTTSALMKYSRPFNICSSTVESSGRFRLSIEYDRLHENLQQI